MQQNMRRFASLRAKTRSGSKVWVLLSIDFLQAIFAQTVAVMFFQIGFCGVLELHFHAPAVNGMDTFEGFSATGTGFGHGVIVELLNC